MMSPKLPITSDDIVQEAVAAAEGGTSVLHLHVRDPERFASNAIIERQHRHSQIGLATISEQSVA